MFIMFPNESTHMNILKTLQITIDIKLIQNKQYIFFKNHLILLIFRYIFPIAVTHILPLPIEILYGQ